MQYLELVSRLTLIAVFMAASFKVVGRSRLKEFTQSISDLRLVPPSAAKAVGGAVVAAEVSVIVLLATFDLRRLGYFLAGLLLAAFTAATVTAIRRGRQVSCRCFGRNDGTLGWPHVWRNGFLLVIAIVGLLAPRAETEALTAPPVLVSALAAVGLSVLSLAFVDIVALFRDPRSAVVAVKPLEESR